MVSTLKTEMAAAAAAVIVVLLKVGKKRKKTKLNKRKFFEKSKIQLKETCKYDVNDNSKF